MFCKIGNALVLQIVGKFLIQYYRKKIKAIILLFPYIIKIQDNGSFCADNEDNLQNLMKNTIIIYPFTALLPVFTAPISMSN